jgi:hypothetical protein
MKELSIEQKAKAYDEAYKKVAIRFGSNVADEIFPELKESEDERIMKAIGYAIGQSTHSDSTLINGVSSKKALAWLEKQGQTFTQKDVDDAYLKGVCDTKQELEKQGEQKVSYTTIQNLWQLHCTN